MGVTGRDTGHPDRPYISDFFFGGGGFNHILLLPEETPHNKELRRQSLRSEAEEHGLHDGVCDEELVAHEVPRRLDACAPREAEPTRALRRLQRPEATQVRMSPVRHDLLSCFWAKQRVQFFNFRPVSCVSFFTRAQ